MIKSASRRARRRSRCGTAAVEVALILPIFFAFVVGLIEYGRLQMVSNMLQTACRTGARLGSTESVTTAEAVARVQAILSSVLDTNDLTVMVKNAGVFDTSGSLPQSAADYAALADIELSSAEPRQLFLIRATVAYNDVALVPFSVLEGVNLIGQAMMRHE